MLGIVEVEEEPSRARRKDSSMREAREEEGV